MKHGRNAPCPCGSGKKYKKCCLEATPEPVDLLYRRLSETHNRLVDRLMDYAVELFEETTVSVAMADGRPNHWGVLRCITKKPARFHGAEADQGPFPPTLQFF